MDINEAGGFSSASGFFYYHKRFSPDKIQYFPHPQIVE